MRYKTRPIELEAHKYSGDQESLPDWARTMIELGQESLVVETSEGQRQCEVGDYLIRTGDGKQAVRIASIFDSIFEPVGSPK